MNDTHRQNLAKLSTYLHKLPDDYARFEMATFLGYNAQSSLGVTDEGVQNYITANGGLPGCGTVACAAGHGPAAHIFLLPTEVTKTSFWDRRARKYVGALQPDWFAYAERAFGADDTAFEWMFGGGWSGVDNTPHGAARRIDYFLDHGVPAGFDSSSYDAKDYANAY